jgi:tetratricopeptide (TPR) repeat protein
MNKLFSRVALPVIVLLGLLPVLAAQASDLHYSVLSNLGWITTLDALSTKDGEILDDRCFSPLLVSAPFSQADLSTATTHLQRAFRADSTRAPAAYGLGYVLLLQHQYNPAWTALSILKPQRDGIAIALWVNAGLHIGELQHWDEDRRVALGIALNQQARQTLLAGCRNASVVLYELATEIAPEESDFWLDRIDVYADEWEKALNALKNAKDLYPTDPYFDYVGAYLAYFAHHDRDTAEKILERTLDYVPDADINSLSPQQRKWLYRAYLLWAELVIQRDKAEAGRTWLEKALLVAGDAIPSDEARARLAQLQSTGQ